MTDKTEVVVSPYVAASIIEHAKRRAVAAGFVFGSRTTQEILITDFVPMTHTGKLENTKSNEYIAERTSRIANKRAFSTDSCIGWYSAGSIGDESTEGDFKLWCQAPGLFMLNDNKVAIHLHCSLPVYSSAPSAKSTMAITWTAGVARLVGETATFQEDSLPVVISPAGSKVAKVVVNYAQSEALYGGAQPYETHPLLELDTVAFLARKLALEPQVGSAAADAGEHGTRKNPHSAVNAALLDAQKTLRTALEHAEGNPNAADSKEVLEALKVLHEVRVSTQDRQQSNVAVREDYATEKFKNALMIKCMAAQLRLQTKQILELASKYPPKKVEE